LVAGFGFFPVYIGRTGSSLLRGIPRLELTELLLSAPVIHPLFIHYTIDLLAIV
jgi:hypothetical protein